MDPIQVAFLTLAALVTGALVPVMVQLWLTLRDVRQELRAAHTKLDPAIAELRAAVAHVRGTSQITTAVATAVTAGVKAWHDARNGAEPGVPRSRLQQQESAP